MLGSRANFKLFVSPILIYTSSDAQLSSLLFDIFKSVLIWIICFYFSFVFAICSSKVRTRLVMRDLFTEKVLSRWDNFNLRDRVGQNVVERV